MVVRSKTTGKEENSRGRRTLIDIITITRPAIMLNVNSTSSKIEGSGTTNIAIITKMTIGIPRPFASEKFKDCRKLDNNNTLI
jgi:hypothetical protein